ncbi:MAG: c-type cytochrome domain-containing protein, partial [Acidobacteriota bacterium]
MRRKVQGLVLLALAGILVAGTIFSIDGRVEAHLEADPGESAAPVGLDFNREVRPILSDKCFQCHGPDEKTRQARLRLDTRDGAMAKA